MHYSAEMQEGGVSWGNFTHRQLSKVNDNVYDTCSLMFLSNFKRQTLNRF